MKKHTPYPSEKPGASGAAYYTKLMLVFYDYFVLGFMSTFVWRCSTRKIMIPFMQSFVTKNHLDIGCGTGYFLQHGKIPPDGDLALCDLNTNCLNKAKERLRRPKTQILLHDILEPLPDTVGPFDSISMFYLLHCLPGPTSRKTLVLKMLKRHLTPDGILYGCTILGPNSGNQTWLSKFALGRINRKGHMGNLGDTEIEFVEAFRKNYRDVDTWIEGSMMLFKAKGPIP